MNIKEAKIQIANTLKAYLSRDELGNYLIPPMRQRPVLLLGAPGIGKTQIMEQIAAEENIGLVAYTITHHTRQSAIGLPLIEHRVYDGTEFTVTEYTMSEIIGSVYSLMEKTGIREGILFLDEINCVSETLAPMMLQFLQCKTFGNRKLPEGWLIVAAGNPPEYNRSVREFDVVTLDRVKKITVEQDFGVWREYARHKGLHNAVVSYLDLKKDNFYRLENTAEGLQFATPRGWEDLSEFLAAYEKLGLACDETVVEQYIQLPAVARDFANYLALYNKYRRTYHIDGILRGEWVRTDESEFRAAPFDEKLSVLSLIYAGASDAAREVRLRSELTDAVHADLTEFRDALFASPSASGRASCAESAASDTVGSAASDSVPASGASAAAIADASAAAIADVSAAPKAGASASASDSLTAPSGALLSPADIMDRLILRRREELKRSSAAGQNEKQRRDLRLRELGLLEEYRRRLEEEKNSSADAAMDRVRELFAREPAQLEELAAEAVKKLDNAFAYLEAAAGESQELVLFVTELTSGFDTSWLIENYGCDAYFRHNSGLLFDDTRRRILEKITAK